MSAIEILAVIGIIGYVIFRQVQGEPLRGKRAVLLPAILTVIGFVNLHGNGGTHLTSADIGCLVAGIAGSAAIGLAFGAIMRLEEHGGYLWAQLPVRGLWLWAALVAWRVAVIFIATGMHAHVAASTSTLLLSLGVNRLAQAAVIVVRAMGMGVPFAPEKDGKVFMGDTFTRGFGARDGRDDDHEVRDDRHGYDSESGHDGYGLDDQGRRGRPQSWDRGRRGNRRQSRDRSRPWDQR